MPNPSATEHAPERWAEVRSHDQVMRYRRSGVGPSIVMLRSPEVPAALWPELADALAARFRLIVPEPPTAGTDVTHWLADFLEGLGIAGVSIVASEAFCIPALELALLGADQLVRVVLVPQAPADETGLEGTLLTSMGDAEVALLIVRRGVPASQALPLLMPFLAGETPAATG
jgi:hypothetical protein